MEWEYSTLLNDWVYMKGEKLYGLVIILDDTHLAIAKEKIDYFKDLDEAKKAVEDFYGS